MNPTRRTPPILVVIALALALLLRSHAAEAPAPASAADLASRLSALYQNGSTYVRARMEIQGATKETLQLQIKQRRTKTSTDILYQVLFPKDRKGESVLLRKTGDRPSARRGFILSRIKICDSADRSFSKKLLRGRVAASVASVVWSKGSSMSLT